MLQKDDPHINWNRIYFLMLLSNGILVSLFYILKVLFNIHEV